jgi:hypothetical protein
LTDEDQKLNRIAFIEDGEFKFTFPFPLERLTNLTIKKLKQHYLLSRHEEKVMLDMLMFAKVDEPFVIAMFAHFVLENKAKNLATENIFSISRPKVYPVKKFVRIPKRKNIFFVIDGNSISQDLLCVEVDEKEEITYRLVWLNLRQTTEVSWLGKRLEVEELAPLVDLTEEGFYKKISDIKVIKGERSKKDTEEY